MKKSMRRYCMFLYIYASIVAAFVQGQQLPYGTSSNDGWITVFVHGIINVQPHLNLSTILQLMNDRVEGSTYQKRIAALRSDPFFQRNQAIQGLGLVPVDKSNTSIKNAAASALATIFDQIYTWKLQQPPEKNHYYTYGWSGLLSPSIRLKESHECYQQLKAELAKYYTRGMYPKLRMVGYSHGGNIILGLARAYQQDQTKTFTIDETILLGVPIQEETDHFVTSSLFKRIINMYSRADRIQSLDYFSYKRFGSDRRFKAHRGLKLPKKLTQIELRLFRNTKNSEKHPTCYDKRYDFDDQRVLRGHTQGLRDTSPGHCELWSFGWTRTFYRKDFTLSPLPVVALFPYLIESVKELALDFPAHQQLIADVRLDQERLIIRETNTKNPPYILPFLSRGHLEELKNIARSFAHSRPTKREYQRRLSTALARAREPEE